MLEVADTCGENANPVFCSNTEAAGSPMPEGNDPATTDCTFALIMSSIIDLLGYIHTPRQRLLRTTSLRPSLPAPAS